METRKRRAAPPFLKRHELKRCFITLKLFCLAHNSFFCISKFPDQIRENVITLSRQKYAKCRNQLYISSQKTSVLVTEPIITLKFKNENLYYFEIVRLKLSAVKAKKSELGKEKQEKKSNGIAFELLYSSFRSWVVSVHSTLLPFS